MFDQLETMVGRYEELGELLSDPQVVNDTKNFHVKKRVCEIL